MADKKLKIAINLPIEKLKAFKNHPYKVIDNEEMEALTESIRIQGILTPIMVRKIEGGDYEIISGHRRTKAAEKAGMKEVPAFVYEISREEAVIMLVDSNLHRERILPSEKAFAYKLKRDALSHQGTTSPQVGEKLLTVEQIGLDYGDSKNQVLRFIRLTNLIQPLLDMVDEGRIAFTPAVELSYLNEVEQADLAEEITLCDATPNLSQAQRLRAISSKEGLTPEIIGAILSEEKANQKEKIKIPLDRIRKFFPAKMTTTQIENEIIKMCESRYRRRTDRDAR